MRKLFRIVLISISLINYFQFATIVNAHVFKTDGSIGAVLHINPEDSPISGREANIFFDFKDTESKFDFSRCDCSVKISKNGEQLFSEQIFSPSFDFVFPEKALYTLEISGKAKDDSFQPFKLNFDVRVEREEKKTETKEASNLTPFLVLGTLVLTLTGFAIINKITKKKEEKK